MQFLGEDHRAYICVCREQRGLSQNTIRAYEQDLSCFAGWEGGLNPAPNEDEETLVAFHRFLKTETSVSPATVRRRIVTLKAFMKWRAKRDHQISKSFTDLDLDLRVPRRLPRPVERETLVELLSSSPHILPRSAIVGDSENSRPADLRQTTGLAMRVLLSTGMRIGELTGLCVRDVHGVGGRVRVRGKGDRERTVYITNEKLLADLNSYTTARLAVADSSAPLFVNVNGTRLTEAAFRKRLRQTSKDLDLTKHITPHQFRHSAATMLIEEGVDIRLVQRLLGHASITTTEIYTKVSDTSLKLAIERADTLSTVDPE